WPELVLGGSDSISDGYRLKMILGKSTSKKIEDETYADYGGPDEIFLGDGNSHPISHTVTSYHFISIDGSPLIDSQHPIPSQTTTQPSTYDSPIPSSTPQAPSSPQQPTDSPSLPPSVTLSPTPATFQEQTPDIFEEEHIPHTF
ncbi:hypothetical protein Tco_1355530, partial [Tanacetum coccineum]